MQNLVQANIKYKNELCPLSEYSVRPLRVPKGVPDQNNNFPPEMPC